MQSTRTTQLRAVCQAKTIGEMLQNITWNMVSVLAGIPLLLFALTPLYQLIRESIDPPQLTRYYTDVPIYSYAYTMDTIFSVAAVFGILVILITIGKTRQQHLSRKEFLQLSIPMLFFLVFLLCMLISTCINGFTSAALHGDPYRNESLLTYMLYILAFFFCGTMLRSKKARQILLYTILGISCVIACSALVQAWIVPLPAYGENVGLSTVFHQFNHYGYYLLISILLSSGLFVTEQNGYRKGFCLFAFVLNNVVLIVNDTFGCYLAVFLALIFQNIFFWVRNKKINWLSLLMLGVFLGISLLMSIWYDTIFGNLFQFTQDISNVAEHPEDAESAGTGRWTLWTHTMQYISEKPLFGFGVEGIHDRLDLETNHCNNRPHNEYLQYAAFFGIPALLCYLGGVLTVLLRAWKQRHTLDGSCCAALIAACGYLISAFFGNTMYYTAPYLFLLLGMCISNRYPENSKC